MGRVADKVELIPMYNGVNRFLILTSIFFFLTGAYGMYYKDFMFSPLLIAGASISINFWRDPKYDYRRTLDILFANVATCPFVYNTLMNIENFNLKVFILASYGLGAFCFWKACNEYFKKNKAWYVYHMLFHSLFWCGHVSNILFTISHN
jgi:hypothetical protein